MRKENGHKENRKEKMKRKQNGKHFFFLLGRRSKEMYHMK